MKPIAWLALCAAALGWEDARLRAAEVPASAVPTAQTGQPAKGGSLEDGKGAGLRGEKKKSDAILEKPGSVSPQDETLLGPPLTGSIPSTQKLNTESLDKKEAPIPLQGCTIGDGWVATPGPVAPTVVPPLLRDEYGIAIDPNTNVGINRGEPQLLLSSVDPRMGIYFMRPYWSRRDFSISVPGGNGAGAVLLSDTRDVARDYTVAPVLNLTLQFTNLDLTFTGVQYALASTVDQTINAGATNASLAGKSSLTIREATAGEVSVRLPCPDCLKDCFGEKCDAKLGLGPYYLYLDQTYIAILVNGANKTSLNSSQNYEGFGIVGALHLKTGQHQFGVDDQKHPWYCRLYSDITGAILIGTNKRISDLNVTGATSPSIRNSVTDYVPVGNLELGVEVGKQNLVKFTSTRAESGYGNGINGDAGFRLGAIVQVIGDMGLTSAASPNNRSLNNGSLYLVGFQATFYLTFPPPSESQ
jgi:hypothetical protein